jgi:electron transfer flavoprotein beta subunit
MNIICCVKQVPDPEAPPSSFKVDSTANAVVPGTGVNQVISPFDEQAVEASLRLKEAKGGKVTALSLGPSMQRDVIKKPLSMGADELVLLEDPAYANSDSYSTAFALAAAIKKIGTYDMIICGRQASDWDSGQVGNGIAEFLGIPCVTVAKKIEILDGNKAKVERVVADGIEIVETTLPAVITVSNELGEPRYPTIKGIMVAKKKEPVVWKPADIGVTPQQIGASGRKAKMMKLFQPVKEGKCEIIGGETPEDAATKLALRLREAKVL